MANVGDKVRVIRGIRGQIPVGFETVIDHVSINGDYCRVKDVNGVPCLYLVNRFEVVEEAPVAVEPHPEPVKVAGVLEVGDKVIVVARDDEAGWDEGGMDAYIHNGINYTVARIGPAGWVTFAEDDTYVWPQACLAFAHGGARLVADQIPAIMPAPAPAAPKTGVVKPEDVEPGLRMVFKAPRRHPSPPLELVGKVFVINAKYPHVPEAAYVDSEEEGDDIRLFPCYLENFHHIETKKEIEVGSVVIAVEGYRNLAGVLRLTGGAEYTVKSTGPSISVHGVPGRYARRRFVLKEYYKAPEKELPNDPIPFEKVEVGHYAKVIGWCGVNDRDDNKINDGKFYRISSKDADDQTVCLGDLYDGFQLPAVSCEFYARKGQELARKEKQEKPPLRERFKLKQGNIHHGGLVSFAYRTPDGRENITLSYVCYAPTRHPAIAELYIGARPMLEQVKTQAKDAVDNFKRYADYIINHSPYASAFITKDFDEGVENGLEMDTSKTKSQCIAAAVALRQGHEYYENIPTFIHFLDKGYSGDVAFLMHSVVRRDGKDGWSKTKMGDNHQCFTTKGSKKLLLEAFANGFAKSKEGPCCDGEAYNLFGVIQPGYTTYGHNRIEDPFEDWAWGKLDTKEVGQGWGKKTIIKAESVYALADAITNELKELKK